MNILTVMVAKSRAHAFRTCAFALFLLCVGSLSSCTLGAKVNPPDITTFDQFESSLAQKLTGDVASNNFLISPTPGGAYPVGTLLPYGRTVEIFDECSINQPAPYDVASLDSTYTLTRGVALDAGLSQAIGPLASAGIKITDNSTVTLGLADAKIQQLSYAQLSSLLSQPDCKAKISGRNLLIVRGYVQAKRTFSTKAVNTGDFKAGIKQIANLEAKYDAGSATLTVSDSQPENFLQITSVVFVSAASGAATPPAASAPSAVPPLPSVTPVLVKPTAVTINPLQKGLVYIQIDKNDSPANGDKVKQLLGAKFSVAQNVERISSAKMPTTPQVRYFNAGDKDSADAAVLLLKTVYPNAFAKYVGLPAPAGQLEVWLARQG
ncbi:hypothetical protein [Burkholderia stagnalis]|uniref:hypothetical protein n=1 Tax=Burkholderia stagnalis TaxID=1503054 RepID=UPI000AB1DB9D|nr:hypothetical protein [Burkholderia stagnalis]